MDDLPSPAVVRIRPLLTAEVIQAQVAELAGRISADYAGRPLLLVGVLTGSLVFVADLMRRITLPHRLALLQASSYRGAATAPGELRIDLENLPNVSGADVLLVDDILDTGRTLTCLVDELRRRGARNVRCAVLLWKRCRTETELTPAYCGFEIGDQFVVGYGLDFNDDFRHLPYIGVVEQGAGAES